MHHLLLIYRLAFYSLLKIFIKSAALVCDFIKVTKQEFEAVYSSSFLASAHKERTIKFYSGVSLF